MMTGPIRRSATLWLALPLLVADLGSFLVAQSVERPFPGITHVSRTGPPPRSVVMHVVTIDLNTPGLRFKLTSPGGTRETLRQTTIAFLNQERAQVAINAHFFLPFPSTDLNADAIGLAASDGKVFSQCERPVQSYAIVAHAPAINLDRQNRAAIVQCSEAAATLWTTVSGSAQIITNGAITIPRYKDADHPDGLLTPNGDYSNQRSWYDLPRARTAIGLTADNRTLVLFTVEGGPASDTSGMTVREIAELLVHEYGVYNALNLDGGGSTSLAIDGRVVTRGTREVATTLAVFAER